MKYTLQKTAITLAAVVMGSASAATISVLGEDTTTGANWRTTTTAKSSTFDPNGDNVYGSDGYFIGYSEITGGAGGTPTEATLSSNPSYISSVTSGGPFYVSNAYVDFDNPSLPVGASVADVNGALYYSSGTKFSFDVSTGSEFVLTVLLGGGPGANTPPTSITLLQTAGAGSGTATATSLPALVLGEYVFFNVDAASGDSFDVNIVASGTQGIVGLGFEAVPEPSSAALLGLGGFALLVRRRRN